MEHAMTTPGEEGVIPFTFTGGRFDSPGADLDVFVELKAYRDTLRNIARDIYVARFPGTKRMPNGFDKVINFNVLGHKDGSVKPALLMAPSVSEFGWVQEATIKETEHLFAAIIDGQDWSPSFPISKESKNGIARIGSTLREDEAILHPAGRRYTASTHRLVKESIKTIEHISDTPLLGFITAIDAHRNGFEMRLPSGKSIPGKFNNEGLFDVVLSFVRKHERGEVVRLRCDYLKSISGVERILDVHDVEQFISRDRPWSDRLIELISLQKGWIQGGGLPVAIFAAELANDVLEKACEVNLQLPHIFPTPEGGLQLEYHEGSKHLEITIMPDGDHEGFYYDSSTDKTIEDELSTPQQMVNFLSKWKV